MAREREGLMERKAFPESYDLSALLRFLSDVRRATGYVGAEVKRGDAQGRGWASPAAISQLPKMTVVAELRSTG
jgi:hypothetical protein